MRISTPAIMSTLDPQRLHPPCILGPADSCPQQPALPLLDIAASEQFAFWARARPTAFTHAGLDVDHYYTPSASNDCGYQVPKVPRLEPRPQQYQIHNQQHQHMLGTEQPAITRDVCICGRVEHHQSTGQLVHGTFTALEAICSPVKVRIVQSLTISTSNALTRPTTRTWLANTFRRLPPCPWPIPKNILRVPRDLGRLLSNSSRLNI